MKKNVERILRILAVFVCMVGIFLTSIHAEAKVPVEGLVTNTNAPFITWSPDHQAWTVDLPVDVKIRGDLAYVNSPDFWYEQGLEVSTGVSLVLPTVGTGQHLYSYDRTGIIPVYRWQVNWEWACCIHGCAQSMWHGIQANTEICGNAYYSGWQGYCADCGGVYKGGLEPRKVEETTGKCKHNIFCGSLCN